MNWLVILDPIEGLLPRTDTSLAITIQAQKQGITVDTATIDKLYFKEQACVLASDASGTTHHRSLAEYELIFMRKEPPYDLSFHYATQLLSLSGTLVVNAPEALRNFNEKLIALNFSDFMAPTLVSSVPEIIMDFIRKEGECVIKSLDSFQGKSVQKLNAEDQETVLSFTGNGTQPAMVQKFLDRVYEGDKRVIMLGDKVVGAALRKPQKGYHANFANSDALKTELTATERKIVNTLGPWLLEQGIHFTGLDLIGENLTEINITCPTGIVQISELEERDVARETVDYFISLRS